MGESNWQRINLQNIQAAHEAQHKKDKQANQNMGRRPKQTFLQRHISSVQLFCHVWLFGTPWTAACQAFLFITNSRSLLKLMSIESVLPSNHLISLVIPFFHLQSFPASGNESTLCIRWPKYWSFSFSISPYNKYSGLIPFKMDWLDLLAVQGTLKSLLQKHQFFSTQLSLKSNSHIHTWLLEKPQLWLDGPLLVK